jgi:hypothetical protein
VLPHGASSKEKAILAIHPRSSERGILAFSRERSLFSRQDQLRTFTINYYFFQKETHFWDTELCKALHQA